METTLGRDGQKAGSAGGDPAVLAGEAASRAGTISPTPQEELDLHCYVACCGVANGGGRQLLPPPRAARSRVRRRVGLGGCLPAGGGASGFLPRLRDSFAAPREVLR